MKKPQRILCISRYIPVDSTRPGCPRMAHFAQELKKHVSLELVVLEPSGQINETVGQSFTKVHYCPVKKENLKPFSRFLHSLQNRPSLDERLRFPRLISDRQKWLHSIILDFKPDIIFARGIETSLSIPSDLKVPIVLDFVDSLSLLIERQALQTNNFITKLRLLREASSLRRFEREVFEKSNASLFVSERDRLEVDQEKTSKSSVIQNGVDVDYYKNEQPSLKEPIILFFGVQSYSPNTDAAKWIVEEIAPLVSMTFPQAKIRIVGPETPADIKHSASQTSNVTVVGEVEDLRTEIWKAKLFICPLRFGAGMKNKILVALAGGLPVVATSLAVEGMNLGTAVLLGNSAKELANLSVEILKKTDIQDLIKEDSLKEYSWKDKGEKLMELFQFVLSNSN